MSTSRARSLRKRMSFAEAAMWKLLRVGELRHLHFRRQVPIGPYYADFASHAVKLIIEVDGQHHITKRALQSDERRSSFLRLQGYRVVRFWAPDVLRHGGGVAEILLAQCAIEVSASGTPPTASGRPARLPARREVARTIWGSDAQRTFSRCWRAACVVCV